MWQKILIAYDGSEGADEAFKAAAYLVKATKTSLVAVAVIRLPLVVGDVTQEQSIEKMQSYFQQKFAALKSQTNLSDNEVQLVTEVGIPEAVLIEYAASNDIDLIVIGFRKNRSIIGKLVLGSVTNEVSKNTACSVLVVK